MAPIYLVEEKRASSFLDPKLQKVSIFELSDFQKSQMSDIQVLKEYPVS